MLARNKYNSFSYVGDIKRLVLESKELSVKILLKDDWALTDSRFDSMADHRILDIAKGKALTELSRIVLDGLDMTINRNIEFGAVEVIFSIKVLDDTSRENFNDEIKELNKRIKHLKTELNDLENEQDYIEGLKNFLESSISKVKTIEDNLSRMSFWNRLKFLVLGSF